MQPLVYVCSQCFESGCFIKPFGGQGIRLKPRSVSTRFIFSVKGSARKKPCYRATRTPTTIKTNNNRSGTAAKSLLEVFDSSLQNNEASPDVNSGETLNVF